MEYLVLCNSKKNIEKNDNFQNIKKNIISYNSGGDNQQIICENCGRKIFKCFFSKHINSRLCENIRLKKQNKIKIVSNKIIVEF